MSKLGLRLMFDVVLRILSYVYLPQERKAKVNDIGDILVAC